MVGTAVRMDLSLAETSRFRWERVALLGVLVLAALLYGWSLGDRVLQPYYAAAVHSMSRDGTAFLFAGYDPVGVVSLDKPPMAFWVQTVGVWIFGYHWWAIALVAALEGVAAVLVLHRTVRRWAGEHAALLAALLLALSPITTAVSRDNTPDTLLVLLLLLAAYCVTRAVPAGATGWMALAGGFAGMAFLTKMLAGWIVLPGLALAYLAAPVSRGRRLGGLLLAGVVTVAVSLSWPLLVTLWPGHRPFVGSTTNGSIWQLIIDYNGLDRVAGGSGVLGGLGPAMGAALGGRPGLLRLVNGEVAGQIGWLLPVAVVSLIAATVAELRGRGEEPVRRAGWALWGGWLVACVVVFSFTGGIFHPYYTAELAPAVAALSAAGLMTCLRWYREGRRAGLLLPVAVAVTAAMAFQILDRTPSWAPWLRPAIVLVTAGSVLAALIGFPGWRTRRTRIVLVPAAVAGLLAMVAGPAAFAVAATRGPADVLAAGDPSAGPSSSAVVNLVRTALSEQGGSDAELAYVRYMGAAYRLDAGQRQVLDYARRHDSSAPITLAVEGGTYGADPFLLNTDAPVAALGGYLGFDPAPTAAQLSRWTAGDRVRFVLLPQVFLDIGRAEQSTATARPKADSSPIALRIAWLIRHCPAVPSARIGPAAAHAGVLFDCRP